MALICAAGHAIAGWSMFYRPSRSDVRSELHAGVFAAMWHIITTNFTLSAIALIALSTRGHGNAAAWLVAAQFAGYAAIYLVISLTSRRSLEALSMDAFWRDRDSRRVRGKYDALTGLCVRCRR